MDVYLSTSNDARNNLALEESLLFNLKRPILFLYENNPAIVIGRCQNPWRECRTGLARRMEIPIFRRISGGGTVVHGPGNLNWSLIAPVPIPSKEDTLKRMIRTLGTLGLSIDMNDRYDLTTEESGMEKKISGSAFRQILHASLHHATILVSADLNTMRSLLDVPPRNIQGKGVVSKRSPVANLADILPGLTLQDVVEAIAGEWSGKAFADPINPNDFIHDKSCKMALDRLESQEWTWDKTPPFTEYFDRLPDSHGKVLKCKIRSGQIARIFMDDEWDLTPLVGKRYNRTEISGVKYPGMPPWLDHFAAMVESDVSLHRRE